MVKVMRQIKPKKRKGFTLVELIVVIGILLILGMLAAVAYGSITREARRSALRTDVRTLASALNIYNAAADTVNRMVAADLPITAAAKPNGSTTNTTGAILSLNTSPAQPVTWKDLITTTMSVVMDEVNMNLILGGGPTADVLITYDAASATWMIAAANIINDKIP
jgi:prepilin-type N-terminal cleavage/methylation domain-containing protein